ncbi:hypothetical protein ACJMK2_005289 [Sinanodonta woodiana]|uniref:MICOS complex subunit MIC60 n=1 Tax=Sinanodonta woodiana TaxID=1069815 RepID=A0ABD3VPK9_SINWO
MWKTTSTGVSARIRGGCCRKIKNYYGMRLSTEAQAGPQPKASPPPPPKEDLPPPKKRGIFGKLLGLTFIGVGGTVGYAWYDPSFKKQIEDNVPYSKDAFDFLFPYLPESFAAVKSRVPSLPSVSQYNPFGSEVQNTKEEGRWKRRETSPDSEPESIPLALPETKPKVAETKKEKEVPIQPVKEETVEERRQRERLEAARKKKEREEEEAAENAALEVNLENLVLSCTNKSKQAIEVQNRVLESTKSHVQLLKKAMDDTTNILDKDAQWEAVATAFEARQDAVLAAHKDVTAAREVLEKLKHTIEEGKKNKVTSKNKMILPAKETLNNMSSELNKMQSQVEKTEGEAKVMLKYKDLIDKGRQQFKKELESIMPAVKLGDRKGMKLTEDELNSMIAHAHRRIEQLQKQLAEQIALEQQRVQRALEDQQKEDEKIEKQHLAQEAERLQNEFAIEKEKWVTQIQFEEDLRHHLARQAAAHSEHLQEVLRVREKELEIQFERVLHTKLLEERSSFHTEMVGWIARLKGIEAAVDGRAESEKMAQQAQTLWLACVALNGAIRLGNPEGAKMEEQLRPLSNEVEAISKASGNHPFVMNVIEKIPEQVLTKGVWTEDNLRARFPKVQKVCRRVSMVDETGGSLLRYFLSYLQSVFIFDSIYAKCKDTEVDVDDLNTFSILASAKFWLERGEFENAVRLMNQLQGAPRRVAADWIEEAKLYLEARQAAMALMAFASARGLGTIF